MNRAAVTLYTRENCPLCEKAKAAMQEGGGGESPPDVHLGWGKMRVTLWSHDVNAITGRDFRLAARMDEA